MSEPYVRTRMKNALVAMAEWVYAGIAEDTADGDIVVVLASHGTPYVFDGTYRNFRLTKETSELCFFL